MYFIIFYLVNRSLRKLEFILVNSETVYYQELHISSATSIRNRKHLEPQSN